MVLQKIKEKNKDRDSVIIRTSAIGIITNVLLAAFKATVGFLSNSIAIVMDAVNNLSDAASSVITIAGTFLAGKEPDKEHPFGHGRVEYLSSMLIAILVLYAGITALIESVKKIINPVNPEYSAVTLIIVTTAIFVKIILGSHVKKVGKEYNSDSLVNSGADALLDALISLTTLLAAVIFIVFHISLEAYLGAVISLVIIKSGVDMLKETISHILGKRIDAALANAIKETVRSYPEISGAYDLILHNYGPDTYNGSVHIEVPDTLSANDLDKLIRKVSIDVYEKHSVILTAVGVYSVNTRDPEIIKARDRVSHIVLSHDYVTQMHGFYLDKEEKSLRLDVVVSFDAPDRQKVYEEVCADLKKNYPGYSISAEMDADYSEM